MMVEILLFLIIFETVFYHSHVLLHSKHLFKYHKVQFCNSNVKEDIIS